MKKLLLMGVLALAGASLAQAQQAVVWPQKWTVSKPSEVKRGGTVRGAVISDYRTFNPFTTAESGNVPDLISAGGFLSRDPSTGDWFPYMAESYTISANKLDLTFKVRRGMKWSDGKPITADDWVTTFKIHTDDKVGSNSYDSFFLDDKPIVVRKIDDYTVRISFPKTDAEALSVASFDPWPDHIFGPVYKAEGADGIKKMWQLNMKVEDIVTSGPWLVEAYRPGERITFKRNPTFGEWNKDEAGAALPYVDKYEIIIVKDTNAQLAAFLNGNIDFYSPSTVDQISQVRTAINDKKITANLQVNASPVASSQFVVFNWNKKSDTFKQGIFRSSKFRQAFSHMVNRQAIVDVVYGGLGTPTYSSVYPVLTQWVNPSVTRYDFDLKKAETLVKELGFTKKDKDGWVVNTQGKRLEFNLATNAGNKQREDIVRLISDEAKKIGVKVNATYIDFNVLVGQLTSKGDDRPFDAILIGLSGGGLDWPFGANVVPCGTNLHAHNNNEAGSCLDARETQLDALFSRGRSELDFKKRQEIGNQMQVVEAQLQPFVYVAGPNQHFAWNSRVAGEYPEKLRSAIWGSRSLMLSWIK